MYYDRQCSPLELLEWAKMLEDDEYKVVKRTTLLNGKVVSTVWLGIDLSFGGSDLPLIFETMVFPPDSFSNLDCERYSTEAEAEAGHDRMVEKWSGL